jgi:DNA-binding MarR family transcriptional regulator
MVNLNRETVANVLGALAQAIVDGVETDTTATVGQSATAAAALVHLTKYAGESIDTLRRPLDLSHPGCVRMVDRLEQDELVERYEGADRRAVAVHLTADGAAAARTVLRKRRDVLQHALETLSAAEVRALGAIAGKILARLVHSEPEALRVCRLCDYRVCPDGVCPVGIAVSAAAGE